jgi:23S rRNA-intervening sequence protein
MRLQDRCPTYAAVHRSRTAVVDKVYNDLERRQGLVGSGYKDLKAWQKSMELTFEVYGCTRQFPATEMYGLTSQMRRAAVSVASNIAEGKGKSSDAEFTLFLCHARASLHELGGPNVNR